MTPREELEMLRARKARIAELEAKAAGTSVSAPPPAEESSVLGDLAKGAKSTLDRTALGLKGLLPQSVQDAGDAVDKFFGSGGLTKETAVQTPDSTAGKVGAIGTDIGLAMIPGNAALKGGQVLQKAIALKNAGTAARALGTAAAVGTDVAGNAAASAAMTPEERENAAMWGAGGAAAGRVAGRVLGGGLRESVSPEAKALMDKGIDLTPGQAVAGAQASPLAKALRGTEQVATKLPFVGDIVKNAQTKSILSYNASKINDALKPLGVTVEEAGLKGLADAEKAIAESYAKHLPNIKVDPVKGFEEIKKGLATFGADKGVDVQKIVEVNTFVKDRVKPLLATGKDVSGEAARKLDSELSDLIAKANKKGDEALAKGYSDLQSSWRNAIEGKTPEAVEAIKKADAANAALAPIKQAAEKSATGVFTPKQMADALRKEKLSPDDITEAARYVLPEKVPSGTEAARTIMHSILTPRNLGSGIAGTASFFGSHPIALASALAAGLYTRPGLKAATEGIHPLVEALRKKAGKASLQDPEVVEDIIRNLSGRGITSAGTE